MAPTVQQQEQRITIMARTLRTELGNRIPDPAVVRIDGVRNELEVQLLQCNVATAGRVAADLGIPDAARQRRSRFRGNDIVYTWRGVILPAPGFWLQVTLMGLGHRLDLSTDARACQACHRIHDRGACPGPTTIITGG